MLVKVNCKSSYLQCTNVDVFYLHGLEFDHVIHQPASHTFRLIKKTLYYPEYHGLPLNNQ